MSRIVKIKCVKHINGNRIAHVCTGNRLLTNAEVHLRRKSNPATLTDNAVKKHTKLKEGTGTTV